MIYVIYQSILTAETILKNCYFRKMLNVVTTKMKIVTAVKQYKYVIYHYSEIISMVSVYFYNVFYKIKISYH